MNVLTLSIKQKFFDEILAGNKTQEFREIRPNTSQKYVRYKVGDKEYKHFEEVPEDQEPEVVPVKYDAIKFLTGEYKGTRPFAIVEVKGANVEILTDEDGNEIPYEVDGVEYVMAQIVYDLGKVIEKSNV